MSQRDGVRSDAHPRGRRDIRNDRPPTASVGEGALLLLAYSLGLMLPFAGAGAFSGWTLALLQRHGHALNYATQAGGILLIALGIIVFTNLMPVIVQFIPIGV